MRYRSITFSRVMLQLSLFLLSAVGLVFSQSNNEWQCDSLICDPPKRCLVKDQIPQCLFEGEPPATASTPNLFGGPVFTQPPPVQTPIFRNPTPQPTQPILVGQPPGPTTTVSPFAPLLNLFGSPLPLTLPTLPPPPTTTTTAPVNVCELPPVTGNCHKARIMWYFDTETGKCERFSYSGCGNGNRFTSRLHCEETCGQHRK